MLSVQILSSFDSIVYQTEICSNNVLVLKTLRISKNLSIQQEMTAKKDMPTKTPKLPPIVPIASEKS